MEEIQPTIDIDNGSLIITITGAATLPAGTHISFTIIVGGVSEAPPTVGPPEPEPQAPPKPRYIG